MKSCRFSCLDICLCMSTVCYKNIVCDVYLKFLCTNFRLMDEHKSESNAERKEEENTQPRPPADARSRSRSPPLQRTASQRSRSPSPAAQPPPAAIPPPPAPLQPAPGGWDCPKQHHCKSCINASAHPRCKPAERLVGCCGVASCDAADVEFIDACITPDHPRCRADLSEGQWRFRYYNRAYRHFHGIGQRGVRIPFPTCVNAALRDAVEQAYAEAQDGSD